MVNSTFVVDCWCSFLCDGKDQCCFEPEKYYHVELKFTPAQLNLPTAYDNFSWKCAPSRRGNVFFSNDAKFSWAHWIEPAINLTVYATDLWQTKLRVNLDEDTYF